MRFGREAAKLSQSALARLIDVKSQSVNGWEHNKKKPSRENLAKFITATGCPSHWLLYGGPLPEQDENGRFVQPFGGGRFVPLLKVTDAISGGAPEAGAPKIHAYFPCGENSYYFILPDNSNAPVFPEGTVWIVDPDLVPTTGRMVLARHGNQQEPIFGRLEYETTAAGRVTIISPLGEGWPKARSDLEPVEIVSVMTESIRSGG